MCMSPKDNNDPVIVFFLCWSLDKADRHKNVWRVDTQKMPASVCWCKQQFNSQRLVCFDWDDNHVLYCNLPCTFQRWFTSVQRVLFSLSSLYSCLQQQSKNKWQMKSVTKFYFSQNKHRFVHSSVTTTDSNTEHWIGKMTPGSLIHSIPRFSIILPISLVTFRVHCH